MEDQTLAALELFCGPGGLLQTYEGMPTLSIPQLQGFKLSELQNMKDGMRIFLEWSERHGKLDWNGRMLVQCEKFDKMIKRKISDLEGIYGKRLPFWNGHVSDLSKDELKEFSMRIPGILHEMEEEGIKNSQKYRDGENFLYRLLQQYDCAWQDDPEVTAQKTWDDMQLENERLEKAADERR